MSSDSDIQSFSTLTGQRQFVDSKIKKEDEEIAAKGSFIHLLLKSRRSYPPLTTRTELHRLLCDTPKLLRNLLNACELKRFRLESIKTQHFCQMACPNRYCYGFLLMISCSCGVLLIAPTEAEDDAGSLLGGKKLIIGLPYKSGYTQFVDVQQLNSSDSNQVVQVGGYSINVFDATIAYLKRSNYNISFEYRAFVDEEGNSAGDYDALVHQIFEGKYDAVVGDVTILAKRLNYADFTLPYTHSNVKMLVKVRHDPRLNMWIFVRPFSWSLWLSIAIISTFIGGILLFMERNVNKDSTHENAPCRKQFNGISILWFPVVQAIFPERESLAKNCSRFVLVMWLILVFVLMQSYTASLSSILTIHQLQPRYLSENDVTEDPNIIVGYNHGSFVGDLLINGLKIDRSRVKSYASIKDYKEALDKGSRKGGVDAIFDEAPYFKAFLKNYGSNYAVVGTRHHAGGFGFAFRKGSTLTPHFSKAILNISESNEMDCIQETYFGSSDDDKNQELSNSSSSNDASPSLTAYSFAGLFMVIGILSLLALLVSECHIWRKPVMLAQTYSQQFFSRSSKRISPLEEGSPTTIKDDKECYTRAEYIGSEVLADN
ncbi:glutamate receptor 2.8-like [Prosopis cineraria]|uniref:glutamate receptor 2.8-like n=1 Tax=Prosopis cineraria TaxID=364024 RepID=UPI00240FD953|nr:glutamate receptor 2.8-like [Prosopis cineraria]